MPVLLRVSFLLLSAFAGTAVLAAQQGAPANRISLDVVVTDKSGKPVVGLQQGDFTVLDNKVARPIATFSAVSGQQVPTEVVLLVDAVNTNYDHIAYEREEIDKFLRAGGGHLAHPTALAIFTDTGTQLQEGFTTDGNGLSESLDQAPIGLREIRRDSGFFGAEDRLQLSLTALSMLVAKEAARPGRKIILWVSPGWPLLSGPESNLQFKEEQKILVQIEELSTTLRRGNITLYSIDPLGTGEGVARLYDYQAFLKGVSKPNQVQLGDLGLQVLAVQSGGLALSASNNVSGLLERCIADRESYYELSFDAPPGERSEEYHQVDIKVAKPGLTARTRTGYYSLP